jgi:hypothetical protein
MPFPLRASRNNVHDPGVAEARRWRAFQTRDDAVGERIMGRWVSGYRLRVAGYRRATRIGTDQVPASPLLAVLPSGRLAVFVSTRRLAVLIAAAALVGSGFVGAPAARAATCEIPPAVAVDGARTATASAIATPAASSSVIQIEGGADAVATPAGSAATPVATASASPVGDSAEMLTGELTAISESLAACLSQGDVETVVQLAGERYLGQLFGSSVPLPAEEYLTIARDLTPVPTRIVSVEEVAANGEDRATAVVTQIVGNQLLRAEWTFEPAPRGERPRDRMRWRLAGERQMPVDAPRGAVPIAVAIGERSFTLDETTVAGPDVVLRGSNAAGEDHEMLVLRLAAGYTTADLLRATGPDLPTEVTFIGERPVPAGAEADLVLVDLDPGVYTLVCLFPDEQGLPHLAQGMEATFTVD